MSRAPSSSTSPSAMAHVARLPPGKFSTPLKPPLPSPRKSWLGEPLFPTTTSSQPSPSTSPTASAR
eukprot:scaffold318289_cov41-Tisochrysis_lutea.AAC.1